MVMEYAEQGNLFSHQNTKSVFSETEAFKFFTQTIHGLKYLHHQNIIHRDLKVVFFLRSLKTSFSTLWETSKFVTLGGAPKR